MGLSSLNSALSGLSMSQRQMEVISTNISNVGTEGYTRKILPQYAQAIDGRGVGVLAGTITRNVDLSLRASLWTQVSSVAFNTVQEEYLSRIEQFHGSPDDGISIASKITQLEDSFILLADDPNDSFLQKQAVDEAIDLAEGINEFSQYITDQRNTAQDELNDTIREINNLLEQIADLNREIERDVNVGSTTANSQDLRDQAVKELSALIEVSYFTESEGAMIVQTAEGVELVGDSAATVSFESTQLSFDSYYPDSVEGIYVQYGSGTSQGIEITTAELGGKLGGLVTLRDETFPKQMAQLDELAHKLATRFEAQGLMLFTNGSGSVPADTAPDTSTDPVTSVSYVGFSGSIQVNQLIINDNSLMQTGTTGNDAPSGSNEVIQRILDYTFSTVSHQEALGSIDLAVSGYTSPNDTLQEFLGVRSSNEVIGGRNLSTYADPTSFISATNGSITASAGTFRITLEEADLGLGPVDIDVDLTAVPDGAGSLTQDIIDHITATVIPALSAGDQADLTSMNVQFSVNSNGGLEITSQGDITIDATTVTNGMGATNLEYLGFNEETIEAENPYFDIAVGTNDTTRIYIEPADDEADLLTKLQAVDGLAVQYNTDGELELRPGDDYDDPDFGGSLTIISGHSETSNAAANTEIGAGTIPDGLNLVSALFGSFSTGGADLSPITSVEYGSEISASDSSTVGFREDYLGPGANISTGVNGSLSLADFSQRMINEQSQELISVQDRAEDDEAFLDILEDQYLDDSAVNIDEELSNLIIVQNAYAASAQVLETIRALFDDLLAVM